MEDYKAAAYNVRRTVKEAKKEYGEKMEQKFKQGDLRSVWQGLNTMTDYKGSPSSSGGVNAALVNSLNNFYARFETNDSRTAVAPETGENGREERALTLSEHDVRRVLKQVNIRKAAGPDATFDSNTIVKFADDTAVIGLITNNDERAYLEEYSSHGTAAGEAETTI
ncbi:hypothetical protein SKAU_G00038520 [Synaphobranchus kaupii]|uniref:Uncharacterized protein n=1 Tax=Synaphobranchus kaupii TaxID=118154 RepID=A0A9Q1GF87_SYNKA|nr:hypothetical protein SKAU_G00038520 [Synaphobranchus kaupii]